MLELNDVPKLMQFTGYRIDTSLDYFFEFLNEFGTGDMIDFKLDLDPYYQREHKWDQDRKIKYVEFLLKGGNTGNIFYFNCRGGRFPDTADKNTTYLVDGKQRHNALKEFKDCNIKVFKDLDPNGEGFDYSQINRKLFSQLNFSLKILINSLPTELDELQWYYDLNQGHVPHSKEELDFVLERINFLKNN